MNIYVFECKIHSNSKQACIMKERIQSNAYSAHFIRSLILKFDWSKQVFLSKFLPSNGAAGMWSEFGHKDLILTTLLKASGRF